MFPRKHFRLKADFASEELPRVPARTSRRPAFETVRRGFGTVEPVPHPPDQQRRGIGAWHTLCKIARMTVLADLLRDFRYSARSLRRTPGFTVVAVAVLALGIGATSAIFSLVSAVWLKPLPFADAERLVTLWLDLSAIGGRPRNEVSPGNYADWQPRAQSFESMAVIEPFFFNFTSAGDEPERLAGVKASPNLFTTIGLAPLLGRTFVPDDGGGGVVVVSEGFWLRRLAGDPAAVGRTITLDGSPQVIVGVVPRDFRFPSGDTDVFVPTVLTPEETARHMSFYMYVVAKLRADVSINSARAEMAAIGAALNRDFPGARRGAPVDIVPLREDLAGAVSPTLSALLGAVALVLLIACANVANLLLARAAGRQKELAIRKALGAARGRVLRQLLSESFLLAAMGVVLGLGIAAVCFEYLSRLIPGTLPASTRLALDPRVLGLTIAAALVTVLLFGAGPALVAARRDFSAAFGRALGAQAGARRLRTALVVAEIALTVVLLAGAGLLLRSYQAVLAVDPGFDAAGLLVADTVLPESRYPDLPSRDAFQRRVLENVRAIPGVESAGYASFAPLLFKGGQLVVFVAGQPTPEPGQLLRNIANNRGASPGYFETLGVPLVSGRFIDERDVRSASRVVVVNESLARWHWPDQDPIGQRISIGAADSEPMTVVGVVGDLRQMGLDVPANRELFVPIEQATAPFMGPRQLVVRAAGDPLVLAAAVRRAIWSVDPDQPVANIRSMMEVVDAEFANRSTQLTLIGAFAVLALLLAAVGLYGVLSYTVSQTTAEIGLRMALGAEARGVVGAIVRSALGIAMIGIAIGLIAAYALTRTITAFLYGVSATDPATALSVAVVLLVVAFAAAFVPARRAAGIDPTIALRAEN
jgi:putative ABC transport system permease protein